MQLSYTIDIPVAGEYLLNQAGDRGIPKMKIGVVVAPLNRGSNRHYQWNHLLKNENF